MTVRALYLPMGTSDYRALADLRYEIRKFVAFSEQAARAAGLEPQQHQLLLAVRGLPRGVRPTVGTLAERLCVRHHTAVGLIDTLEGLGLVVRVRGLEDRRQVLVKLTRPGQKMLRGLSTLHRQQLRTVAPDLLAAVALIIDSSGAKAQMAPTRRGSAKKAPRLVDFASPRSSRYSEGSLPG